MPTVFMTAAACLTDAAKIGHGTRVLVHAATGVPLMLCQMKTAAKSISVTAGRLFVFVKDRGGHKYTMGSSLDAHSIPQQAEAHQPCGSIAQCN